LTGHLVLATVVVVTLYSYRLSVPASVPAAAGVVGRLEGAA
jgi:hypothetical protein